MKLAYPWDPSPGSLLVEHFLSDASGLSIPADSDWLLDDFQGRVLALAGSRRCRHDIQVRRMRTDGVEAQHREKVRGVRQEGRIHEVLLYETLLHQRGLRETCTGNLI